MRNFTTFLILFSFLLLPQTVSAALSDELQAWWELEEASGVRVDSHNSNDLTDNNTVGSASGQVGTAADFERSSSEYFSATDGVWMSPEDGSFSVAGWINLESLPGSGAGSEARSIFSNYGSPTNHLVLMDVFGSPANIRCIVRDGDGDAASATGATSLSVSTWYHIALVFDASTGIVTGKHPSKLDDS